MPESLRLGQPRAGPDDPPPRVVVPSRCAPRSINPPDFANREDDGVLLVPKAGEMLYHLKKQPKWAGGN